MHPLPPCLQDRWAEGRGKEACSPPPSTHINTQECTNTPLHSGQTSCVTHMLNATYIWYSSIASTNCPHESKSVAFLKLACHFCIVLLTSDILAGRILATLSGQHSRGGDTSTRLRQSGDGVVNLVIRYPQTYSDTPTKPFLPAHPNFASAAERKSRLELGVRAFWYAGSHEWTATGCLFASIQNLWEVHHQVWNTCFFLFVFLIWFWVWCCMENKDRDFFM